VSKHVKFDESSSPLNNKRDQKWPTEDIEGNREQIEDEPHEPIQNEEREERQLRNRANLKAPDYYQALC